MPQISFSGSSLYPGISGTHSMYFTSIISPAKPRISPDSCVLLTSHCIPRDVNMISPHFWSREEHPIPFWTFSFDPLSHSLIYIPFYAPPQPPSPLNYGREHSPFATNSSQMSRVWPEFPRPELQRYSVWLLSPFFWYFIGLRLNCALTRERITPWEVFPNCYYHPVFTWYL